MEWAAPAAVVAGSDTQVQFNDAGVLAGDAGLTYNKTTDTLTVAGLLKTGSGPTTLTDATGKILSASLNTVAVAQGGTGLTALGTALYLLRVNAGATAFEFVAPSATVAGSDTQVQFNDSGALAGDAGLVYNKTTDTLTVAGLLKTGSGPTTLTDAAGKILSTALNTVAVAQGGTALTALGTALYLLRVNAGATALEYVNPTSLSTSAGGSTTQVQYNNGGAFGGITNATTDGTTLTLTSPKLITALNDTNGNEIFKVTATGSAVNEFTITNAATGVAPILSATGGDTDISISLTPKGAGVVTVNSSLTVSPASGDSVLMMKAAAGTSTWMDWRANNYAGAGVSFGQTGVANSLLTGAAAGDICLFINGNSQRFLTGTATGAAIGFAIESANAGISWGGGTTGTMPIKANVSVFPSSGLATLAVKATTNARARLLLQAHNDNPAAVQITAEGAAGDTIASSAVGDMCISVAGNSQRILFNTHSTTAIGFSLQTANAGISWGGSSTGTVPIQSNVLIFPTSGTSRLYIKATTNTSTLITFQPHNDGPAGISFGAAGAANSIITGSIVGDMCFAINGNSQSFLWSVETSLACAMKLTGTSGQLSLLKNIASTSTTTGTFVVTGGVGISGALYMGGVLSTTDATEATSTTAASVMHAGGLAVAKKMYLGGDLIQSVGKLISIASGTNQRAGDAVLVGGTVTVNNTTVTANTRVYVTRKTAGGTIGMSVTYTVIAATSFTLTSDNILDTSTYSYILVEVP